jgi:hypothetical protein
MSTYPSHATDIRARHRANEARDFRLMFSLAFLLFLAAGALKRLASPLGGGARRKSLIAEAKAAANTCLPFAFMN